MNVLILDNADLVLKIFRKRDRKVFEYWSQSFPISHQKSQYFRVKKACKIDAFDDDDPLANA